MDVDRERILNVDCERTSFPVTRRVIFDAEFNSPHIIEVACPFYFGTFCKRATSSGCLYWRDNSVTESERAI